jgi:hypothetical protein
VHDRVQGRTVGCRQDLSPGRDRHGLANQENTVQGSDLIGGLIGGLGVAAFVPGAVGGLHSLGLSIALAFAIWIVGATLVNVLAS